MSDILIRNVDPETKEYWKDRARKHGRSLQAELKDFMRSEREREQRPHAFLNAIERAREDSRTRPQTDSTVLLREDRSR